jgi:hypothetical protein
MRFFVVFLQDLLQSRAGCLHLCVAGVVSCLIPLLLFLAASRLRIKTNLRLAPTWPYLSVMILTLPKLPRLLNLGDYNKVCN